jgi:predicted RNA-binding protein with PIN domain
MPYLIDGHNLIGKLPNLALDDFEDERALIELLQKFCSSTQKKAEVYFDKASPGNARAKVHGRVTARYIREGDTADNGIKRHLSRLATEASNWTVVSSDREVQSSARHARARVLSAEEFSEILMQPTFKTENSEPSKMSSSEMDEWLDLFGEEPDEK